MNQNVFFLGVARLSEDLRGTVIGSFAYNTEIDLSGVRKVLEQPNLDMSPGKHYSFQINEVTWHLIQDEFSLIYILIASQYYPQRVAHACLNDLQRQFIEKVGGPEAANAKEKTYNKTCASLFNSICKKYDNLTEVDKLAAVQKKIQNVQLVMQENVSLALENCVKLESIEAATEELQQQAGVFKKNSTQLKNKMWWKNIKMWLIIGAIVAIILIITISVGVSEAQAANSGSSSSGGGGSTTSTFSPSKSPSFSPKSSPTFKPSLAPVTVSSRQLLTHTAFYPKFE